MPPHTSGYQAVSTDDYSSGAIAEHSEDIELQNDVRHSGSKRGQDEQVALAGVSSGGGHRFDPFGKGELACITASIAAVLSLGVTALTVVLLRIKL